MAEPVRRLLKRRLSLLLVLLPLAVAACAGTVEGTNTIGQAFELTIVDPQGLVRTASNLQPDGDPTALPDLPVQALDDPNAVSVTWSGRPCQRRPTLTVSVADPLTIELNLGPRVTDFCEAMGVGYGVRLVLNEPVDAEEVEFTIVDGLDP
jgi:hypothetical protein